MSIELDRYEYEETNGKKKYPVSFTIRKGVKSPIKGATLVETFSIEKQD